VFCLICRLLSTRNSLIIINILESVIRMKRSGCMRTNDRFNCLLRQGNYKICAAGSINPKFKIVCLNHNYLKNELKLFGSLKLSNDCHKQVHSEHFTR